MRAIRRAFRRLLACWHQSQLDCLVSEREGYQAAMPDKLGPNYLAECARQERVLRGRIAYLQTGL